MLIIQGEGLRREMDRRTLRGAGSYLSTTSYLVASCWQRRRDPGGRLRNNNNQLL